MSGKYETMEGLLGRVLTEDEKSHEDFKEWVESELSKEIFKYIKNKVPTVNFIVMELVPYRNFPYQKIMIDIRLRWRSRIACDINTYPIIGYRNTIKVPLTAGLPNKEKILPKLKKAFDRSLENTINRQAMGLQE